MFGGPLFEIILVLFFVFLAMSAFVSFMQDLVLKAGQWKSRTLKRGVRLMLEDDGPYGDEIADRFYRHPLISSLRGGKTGITWIEPNTFLTALATAVLPKGATDEPVAALPASVALLREGSLKQRLTLVLPPIGSDRALIETSVKSWFETSTRKIGERYRADTVALSYIVAACATVLLNVSPIEIGQRLMANDALRTTFASVVPELTNTLFSQGEGPKVAAPGPAPRGTLGLAETPAAQTPAADADADADPLPQDVNPLQAASASPALSDLDVQTMWAVYQCSKSQLDLPIGWPWMADAMNGMRDDVSAFATLPTEQEACTAATQSAAGGGRALVSRLDDLNAFGIAKVNSEPLYGPNFATDDPLLILVGWLLMVVAAAQGAPFWFNALKMVLRR